MSEKFEQGGGGKSWDETVDWEVERLMREKFEQGGGGKSRDEKVDLGFERPEELDEEVVDRRVLDKKAAQKSGKRTFNILGFGKKAKKERPSEQARRERQESGEVGPIDFSDDSWDRLLKTTERANRKYKKEAEGRVDAINARREEKEEREAREIKREAREIEREERAQEKEDWELGQRKALAEFKAKQRERLEEAEAAVKYARKDGDLEDARIAKADVKQLKLKQKEDLERFLSKQRSERYKRELAELKAARERNQERIERYRRDKAERRSKGTNEVNKKELGRALKKGTIRVGLGMGAAIALLFAAANWNAPKNQVPKKESRIEDNRTFGEAENKDETGGETEEEREQESAIFGGGTRRTDNQKPVEEILKEVQDEKKEADDAEKMDEFVDRVVQEMNQHSQESSELIAEESNDYGDGVIEYFPVTLDEDGYGEYTPVDFESVEFTDGGDMVEDDSRVPDYTGLFDEE